MVTEFGSSEQDREPDFAATQYRGPTTVTTLRFGDAAIRLVRPVEPDSLLEDPTVLDWNRRDDYMPYWAYLWPGAHLLAEAVARESWPASRAGLCRTRALEIGCGLGLAGLVALARGLDVEFTDYDSAPLQFVVLSAGENGFEPARYETSLLDWRRLPKGHYSVILGADVIYESRLVPLVANLLAQLLARGGTALVASPYRVSAEEFPTAIDSVGLVCRPESIEARSEDGRPIRGTIYRVTHVSQALL
jgi:predicted nicotinamide N-methyase